MKESFVFYKSYYEAIKELPEEYQIEMLDAIVEYATMGKEPTEASKVIKAIFKVMKPNLDNARKRYETNIENGKKGGRPRKVENKNSEIGADTKNTENQNIVDDFIPQELKTEDTENQKTENSNDESLQKIIDFYNNNITLITPYGLEIFQDYLKEMSDEVIIFAMQKAVRANAKNINYIDGILKNWSAKGIKTLIQAQEESQLIKNKASPNETENEKLERKKRELEDALNGVR